MLRSRYITLFILYCSNCVAFLHQPLLANQITKYIPKISNSQIIMQMSKDTDNDKKNVSKIYKLDFSENNELEEYFKPRYAFGISEYDMQIIRISIYATINVYFFIQIFTKYYQE